MKQFLRKLLNINLNFLINLKKKILHNLIFINKTLNEIYISIYEKCSNYCKLKNTILKYMSMNIIYI